MSGGDPESYGHGHLRDYRMFQDLRNLGGYVEKKHAHKNLIEVDTFVFY